MYNFIDLGDSSLLLSTTQNVCLSIYLSFDTQSNPHLENQRNSSVSHLVALRFAQATDTICKERLRNYVNQRISLSRLIRFIVRQQPPTRDRNSILNVSIHRPLLFFLSSFFFFFFLEKRKKRTAEGDTSFHRIGQQQVILTRSEIIFFPLDLFVSRLSKESSRKNISGGDE